MNKEAMTTSKTNAFSLVVLFSILTVFKLYSQTNSFPPSGNAKIMNANLLLETNEWKSSLLTLMDTHYTPSQTYNFQIESDGLKIKQDNLINYQFKTGGDYIINNGKLGVGVINPTAKLEVLGTIKSVRTESSYVYSFFVSGDGNSYMNYVGGDQSSRIGFQMDGSSKMSIYKNGSVTIGTGNAGTHKLAVEGSIGAREIKVEASGWSDFVFEKKYVLPSLNEVEQHIMENGHLKDIPSAKEVEENGIQLGEMNAKLLQKIEELTLYTIQQEKQLNEKEVKMIALEKKINTQEERLDKLEKLLKKI